MTRRRWRTLIALALAAAVTLALAGCGTASKGSNSTPTSSAQPPTLELVKPAQGETISGTEVAVEVSATGLKFTMPSNTNVAGEGHVHFTLDDKPFQMSIKPSYVFSGVAPGEHKLVAELVQNDTKSFSPPVRQEITFTVK